MTDIERQVWIAVYAACWPNSHSTVPGIVPDAERAQWCAVQANKALDSLRVLAEEAPEKRVRSCDAAVEVLRG